MAAAGSLVVAREGVDEVLGNVVALAVREALRREELERGAASGSPVREATDVEEYEAVERVEDDGRGLMDCDDKRAALLDLQRP